MSYNKFLDDCESYLKWRTSNNLPKQHWEENFADVRDKWIADGRYKELTSFILENWDSGNCDNFSQPFSIHLIEKKEHHLFKKLWKGIIRNRLEKLWRDFAYLKEDLPDFTIDKVKKVDIRDFNQFSAKENIERRVAWRRIYIIEGITDFISGLQTFNDQEEIERQNKLLSTVSNLDKPKPTRPHL